MRRSSHHRPGPEKAFGPAQAAFRQPFGRASSHVRAMEPRRDRHALAAAARRRRHARPRWSREKRKGKLLANPATPIGLARSRRARRARGGIAMRAVGDVWRRRVRSPRRSGRGCGHASSWREGKEGGRISGEGWQRNVRAPWWDGGAPRRARAGRRRPHRVRLRSHRTRASATRGRSFVSGAGNQRRVAELKTVAQRRWARSRRRRRARRRPARAEPAMDARAPGLDPERSAALAERWRLHRRRAPVSRVVRSGREGEPTVDAVDAGVGRAVDAADDRRSEKKENRSGVFFWIASAPAGRRRPRPVGVAEALRAAPRRHRFESCRERGGRRRWHLIAYGGSFQVLASPAGPRRAAAATCADRPGRSCADEGWTTPRRSWRRSEAARWRLRREITHCVSRERRARIVWRRRRCTPWDR